MAGEGARDSTRRFSDRVANYVRYRPGYPDALLAALEDAAGLGPATATADVGSGTGISTELLLRGGGEVWAVEPNAEMRAAAEARFGSEPRFHSVSGTAEATTLAGASVDLVAAGQAFHWFDVEATRAELARILRPAPAERPQVALFWNSRLTDASPFLRAYEDLLQRFGTDYAEIDHLKVGPEKVVPFFGGRFEKRTFPNHQDFDYEGLEGRLLSSSYAPAPGHPDHEPMLAALRQIFDQNQEAGRVRFVYDTELYLGRLPGSGYYRSH